MEKLKRFSKLLDTSHYPHGTHAGKGIRGTLHLSVRVLSAMIPSPARNTVNERSHARKSIPFNIAFV